MDALEDTGHFDAALDLIDDPAAGGFSDAVRGLMIDDLWTDARTMHAAQVAQTTRDELEGTNDAVVRWGTVVVVGAAMLTKFAVAEDAAEERRHDDGGGGED